MKRLGSRVGWVTFLAFGFWAFAVPAAHAYIDPGSGSFLAQFLVAGIVAAGLFLKTFWHRIRNLFRKNPASSAEPISESEPDRIER